MKMLGVTPEVNKKAAQGRLQATFLPSHKAASTNKHQLWRWIIGDIDSFSMNPFTDCCYRCYFNNAKWEVGDSALERRVLSSWGRPKRNKFQQNHLLQTPFVAQKHWLASTLRLQFVQPMSIWTICKRVNQASFSLSTIFHFWVSSFLVCMLNGLVTARRAHLCRLKGSCPSYLENFQFW